MSGRSGGSSEAWSVCAIADRVRYRRALSTAVAARSARSSASARSRSPKRRPDSAPTNVTVPIVRSRTRIGATIAERICSSRMRRRCSSLCAPATIISSRDLRDELRAPAADHLMDRRGLGVGRELAPQPLGQRDLLGVGVRHRDLVDLAVLAEEVDPAPVRDLRDGELGRGLERLLVVERSGEHPAGLGQEALGLLALLELGDVLDEVDGEAGLALLVEDGPRLDPRPAVRHGRAARAEADDLGLGQLAGQRAPAGQPVVRERLALRREQVVGGHHLVRAARRAAPRRSRSRAAGTPPRWRRRAGRRATGRSPSRRRPRGSPAAPRSARAAGRPGARCRSPARSGWRAAERPGGRPRRSCARTRPS